MPRSLTKSLLLPLSPFPHRAPQPGFVRVRGLERVALHADLVMLAGSPWHSPEREPFLSRRKRKSSAIHAGFSMSAMAPGGRKFAAGLLVGLGIGLLLLVLFFLWWFNVGTVH
ncbi:MAG TPA: hypothetical protein VEQ41_00295 [Solirubrobacterales bacterium]|nr:hypothetical protein [Solirubrobacterales bacterium]